MFKWDFGDGTTKDGENVNHTWKQPGEYLIKLGVVARDVTTGKKQQFCVSKIINVTSGSPDVTATKAPRTELALPNITDYDHAVINILYSASDDIAEKGIFQLEILSSGASISMSGSPYMKLSPKYRIKEIFQNNEKLYSYVIDEAISFMDLYNSFIDAVSSGFSNARIRTYIPAGAAEKELWNLKKLYDTSSDVFFTNRSSTLQTGAYPVIDQLVILLKQFPELKIEVVVHTDNTGTSASNLLLSDNRAQSIVSYVIGKGISSERLRATGAGDSRPVASNYSESDRKRNRRVDFVLIAN
jgi:outer membrane protein OmpA-like peptidoglycan-associated protein